MRVYLFDAVPNWRVTGFLLTLFTVLLKQGKIAEDRSRQYSLWT
jgi:hypothetical protein